MSRASRLRRDSPALAPVVIEGALAGEPFGGGFWGSCGSLEGSGAARAGACAVPPASPPPRERGAVSSRAGDGSAVPGLRELSRFNLAADNQAPDSRSLTPPLPPAGGGRGTNNRGNSWVEIKTA